MSVVRIPGAWPAGFVSGSILTATLLGIVAA